MANDIKNTVTTYFLEMPASGKELLGGIRHWDNLKAALDGDSLWIKDISEEQAESAQIKGLPYARIYYAKEGLLFLKDRLLPEKKLPGALLWSPLLYILPVVLPSLNHNYFGIDQKIDVKIVSSQHVKPVAAMMANRKAAGLYIQTAPRVRLEKLHWLGIDDNVLIAGTPLLPVEGRSYWLYNDFLLPSGFEFELPLLAKKLKQQLDPQNNAVILWQEDNTYITLNKDDFMPLTISSFRLTYPEM